MRPFLNTGHPSACFVGVSLGEGKQSTSLVLESQKVTVLMMPLLQAIVAAAF